MALMEFAYNNSYQKSIAMAPYEALYGRKCQTPLYWNEVGEKKVVSVENVPWIEDAHEKVKIITPIIRVKNSLVHRNDVDILKLKSVTKNNTADTTLEPSSIR